jgi:hypothetical protein
MSANVGKDDDGAAELASDSSSASGSASAAILSYGTAEQGNGPAAFHGSTPRGGGGLVRTRHPRPYIYILSYGWRSVSYYSPV